MMMLRLAVVVWIALGAASAAHAGDLTLTFKDGYVTVNATAAPLRQILAEWARQGQTRIVGLEKVAGAPLTIVLSGVPEKQALEVLLRSLAGYIAAPRAAGVAGQSFYDRIVLLPTSVASAAPPGGRPTAFAPPPPPPTSFPDPMQIANDETPGNDGGSPPGVPVFNPNEPVNPPGGPAPAPGPNGVVNVPPPQALPLGQSPIRPYPVPTDPPTDANTGQPAGPLTTDRPGVIPIPQTQPKP